MRLLQQTTKVTTADRQHLPTAYHFDSVVSSQNVQVAHAVAQKIVHASPLVASSEESAAAVLAIHPARTPAQSNGYDCGVHVIAAAQAIAATTNHTVQAYEEELAKRMNEPLRCTALRKELVERIRSLHSTTGINS